MLAHVYVLIFAISGRTAAREMYGCKNALGWVAHGFTDSDLDGGIWGDTQVLPYYPCALTLMFVYVCMTIFGPISGPFASRAERG